MDALMSSTNTMVRLLYAAEVEEFAREFSAHLRMAGFAVRPQSYDAPIMAYDSSHVEWVIVLLSSTAVAGGTSLPPNWKEYVATSASKAWLYVGYITLDSVHLPAWVPAAARALGDFADCIGDQHKREKRIHSLISLLKYSHYWDIAFPYFTDRVPQLQLLRNAYTENHKGVIITNSQGQSGMGSSCLLSQVEQLAAEVRRTEGKDELGLVVQRLDCQHGHIDPVWSLESWARKVEAQGRPCKSFRSVQELLPASTVYSSNPFLNTTKQLRDGSVMYAPSITQKSHVAGPHRHRPSVSSAALKKLTNSFLDDLANSDLSFVVLIDGPASQDWRADLGANLYDWLMQLWQGIESRTFSQPMLIAVASRHPMFPDHPFPEYVPVEVGPWSVSDIAEYVRKRTLPTYRSEDVPTGLVNMLAFSIWEHTKGRPLSVTYYVERLLHEGAVL
jgi:hypothetical protein